MSVGASSHAVLLTVGAAVGLLLVLLAGVAVGADNNGAVDTVAAGSPCDECQRNLTSLCCAFFSSFFHSWFFIAHTHVWKNNTDALEELAKVRRVAGLLQDRVSVLNYVTWGVAALAAFFGGMTVFFAVSQDEQRSAQAAAAAAAAATAHKRD